MKIFVHIGTPKTGTTTIQRFLASNRRLMRTSGIDYPSTPGHTNHLALTAYAMAPDRIDELRRGLGIGDTSTVHSFRERFRTQFLRELERSSCHTVVLSNEHCSARLSDAAEIAELGSLLHEVTDDIEVIAYLRRQDAALLSAYSTAVKVGRTEPLRVPVGDERRDRFDYWEILCRWAAEFGDEKIHVGVFERSQLREGDIVTDIADTIGIDLDGHHRPPEVTNVALNRTTAEFLRRFNQHVPRFDETGSVNRVRGDVADLLEHGPPAPPIGMDPVVLGDFMASFRDSNENVARHFLGRANGRLFEEPPPESGPDAGGDTLDVDRAVEIAAHLWTRQQERQLRLVQPSRLDRAKAALRAARRRVPVDRWPIRTR